MFPWCVVAHRWVTRGLCSFKVQVDDVTKHQTISNNNFSSRLIFSRDVAFTLEKRPAQPYRGERDLCRSEHVKERTSVFRFTYLMCSSPLSVTWATILTLWAFLGPQSWFEGPMDHWCLSPFPLMLQFCMVTLPLHGGTMLFASVGLLRYWNENIFNSRKQ